MTTADVLRRAADRVRVGWTQGTMFDFKSHGVCALGAINSVLIVADLDSAQGYEAMEWLARAIGVSNNSGLAGLKIGAWNDDPGQTAENVALAFEAAALLYEQAQALATEQETPHAVTD